MAVDLVIGAPVWDRAWSLPLWFESVRANVDPATTGLAFVTPARDERTRDAIAELSDGFAWVEVMRDPGRPVGRLGRVESCFENLAQARNRILRLVQEVAPRRFLSWDSDLLVRAGAVDAVDAQGLPVATVWAWLNRQAPRRILYDGEPVLWQPPVRATAMALDDQGRPGHYPPDQYRIRATSGTWRCGVALAWQLMDRTAYSRAYYLPDPHGEEIPFNRMLQRNGVPRFCCADVAAVHLYERLPEEIAMGWPGIMALADRSPLAATPLPFDDRTPIQRTLGLYPEPIERGEAA